MKPSPYLSCDVHYIHLLAKEYHKINTINIPNHKDSIV